MFGSTGKVLLVDFSRDGWLHYYGSLKKKTHIILVEFIERISVVDQLS